jgi:ATP-binding cassette subfamily F protein 3
LAEVVVTDDEPVSQIEAQDMKQQIDRLLVRIAELEARIAQLEEEKKSAEAQLADPALFADPARSTPLITAYRDAAKKLDELYARWEHKQEELAAAESRIE